MSIRSSLKLPLLPWWLTNRFHIEKTVGYRILWCIAVVLDVFVDIAIQGVFAAWPGMGTPTANDLIGRSRMTRRGQNESDDSYVARLVRWLERHRDGASARGIARAVQTYLQDHPRVRVVSRGGTMVTIEQDGTIETRDGVAWDWDSISYPARSGWWWEQWVIVYTSQFPPRTEKWGDAGLVWGMDHDGFSHHVGRTVIADILAEVDLMKALRSRVRTIILTTDPTRFDPDNAVSMPDGTWGTWRGNRDLATCKFWETNDE